MAACAAMTVDVAFGRDNGVVLRVVRTSVRCWYRRRASVECAGGAASIGRGREPTIRFWRVSACHRWQLCRLGRLRGHDVGENAPSLRPTIFIRITPHDR